MTNKNNITYILVIFSGAQLHGLLVALPTNIGLGWKGLPGTNSVAYYKYR